MKQFSLSELHRQTGEIAETAITEPVAITKYGKEKFFMVPAEIYNRMMGRRHAEVFEMDTAPADVLADLIDSIDQYRASKNMRPLGGDKAPK